MKKHDLKLEALTVDVCDYMFVEWLVRRGLYSKFLANLSCIRYNKRSSRDTVRKFVANLITSPNFTLANAISASFIFRATPEGPDFWHDASKEWINYLKSFLRTI